MINLESIEFNEYKSFKSNNSLTNLKNINVIIGKNNSGKSSILDVVEFIFDKENKNFNDIKNIEVTQIITEPAIQRVFDKNTSGGSIGGNHYEFGKTLIGKPFKTLIESKVLDSGYGRTTAKYNVKYIKGETIEESKKECSDKWQNLSQHLHSTIPNATILKIAAERDIRIEDDMPKAILSNGEGVTTKICEYLNKSEKDEKLVDTKLLNSLNDIMGEDAHFENIKVQQVKIGDDYKWEIFLTENGNRYELSKMGSGLKTIIIMLVNLYICASESKKPCIYLFEELENNLHPALQRRLFEFLYNYAIENDLVIFLTTHSHVAINSFYAKEKAQIYHVEKNDHISSVKVVKNFFDKSQILDDLDVKASDLFQANGIVWVEGPSDRIYIKKWLELFAPELQENVHYQFVYYGGRLLSHYTVDETPALINILLTNRNSAIVMDSDKRNSRAKINETKIRIENEFKEKRLFSWITKGKEIENYLSSQVLNEKFNTNLPQIGRYELFPDYIKEQYPNFQNHKVEFANDIIEKFTQEALNILDLKEKIKELSKCIKKWNKL